jgi:nicotinamide mononucleotide (NMN) deamidase PncC
MGARYDQVEPHVGIVRVPLNADITFSASGEYGPKAVSINASGRLVIGTAAQSGAIGVLIKNIAQLPAGLQSSAVPINGWMGGKAGDIVDVMTQGEIVDLDTTAFPAGRAIYAEADGDLTTTATGNVYVGFTIEAGRLFVNFGAQPVASA